MDNRDKEETETVVSHIQREGNKVRKNQVKIALLPSHCISSPLFSSLLEISS